MRAFRRAYNLRSQGFNIRASQACCSKSEVASYYLDDKTSCGDFHLFKSDGCMCLKRFNSIRHGFPTVFLGSCSFSSLAGTKSSTIEEDGLEDGLSELETHVSSKIIRDGKVYDENKLELISESDMSEGEGNVEEPQNELELSEMKTDVIEESSQARNTSLVLFKVIMSVPSGSVEKALDKWVEEGNDLTRVEIRSAFSHLKRCRMYLRALKLSEWLESTKQLDFVERDYALQLNLIAKVSGLGMAEKYIESVPKSFRGRIVYSVLLSNFVAAGNIKKAEEIFNKMKDLGFPVTCSACNQLLILYDRYTRKKIAHVLLVMEKENVKPDIFTYRILVNAKGRSNDIAGMEKIAETMKAEGIEPDLRIKAKMAEHYISNGFKEKGEAVLQELEDGNLEQNRGACRFLLPLYAALGRGKDVGRVWRVCESNPTAGEYLAAIEAWGKLNKIEEAEAVFDKMSKKWKKLTSRQYIALLRVYASQKMLVKGKDLVKRMADSGCQTDPFTWDVLVKLYAEAGEVQKADSFLQKATQQRKDKPMFSTYVVIMEHYAERGDVHNSEKMFHRMREVGYVTGPRPYVTLIQAYINANSPAYGMKERMKADNIIPNKTVEAMLTKVDAFRTTAFSDLLD